MAALGGRKAVAQLPGNRVITGFIAWFLWRTYYLLRLPGLDRKLRVAFDWTLELIFPGTRRNSDSASNMKCATMRWSRARRTLQDAPRTDRTPHSRPQRVTRDVKFPDPREIRIYDETLRDGEQMPGVCYTPSQKLEIAKELASVGVHIMSVGFPAASAGDRRTLQLVMEAKRRGELGEVEIVVMCRSNRNDIDVTVKTLATLESNPGK